MHLRHTTTTTTVLAVALLAASTAWGAESEFRRLLDENQIDAAIDAIGTELNFGELHEGDIAPLCQAVGAWGSLGYELTLALLDRGADPNTHCNEQTALYRAARWGRLELVTLLVDRGADVNLDPSGEWDVPLLAAYMHGHERLGEFLEDRGAFAPESLVDAAKKHSAMVEEKERLMREVPRGTAESERQRLQYEITLNALLVSQKHESNAYRQMFTRMYLDRALQTQYDPETDGTLGPFIRETLINAMQETAALLEQQGNWHPEKLSEDLPPELQR